MFTLGVVLTFKGVWYTLWLKGIPYILVASQSGDVVNRLEILFMIGGFQVVCNLNSLVIDRVYIYIYIENPIYLLRFSVW